MAIHYQYLSLSEPFPLVVAHTKALTQPPIIPHTLHIQDNRNTEPIDNNCQTRQYLPMQLAQDYISLTSAEAMRSTIQPLTKHFSITSPVYRKSTRNGYDHILASNPKWVEHFYNSDFEQGFTDWSHTMDINRS